MAGLLYYLWGPGKADEHTRPHMVAAWDERIVYRHDPSVSPDATLPALARLLEAPVEALDGRRPAQHVYHVPVRLAPEDRYLTDSEWSTVAAEILDAVGIAPKGDPERSCRWIAMRHADDHIHIVATLATAEGRVPNVRKDMPRMQARARELEERLGLRRLASGDRTAKQWPTGAELGKAARYERRDTPRAELQGKVRAAAAGARDEANFFARLAKAGVRVQKRTAPDGNITGYSVALPGDRTAAGRAVWFSGSRLAPDLSLPRVRERWHGNQPPTAGERPSSRAEAWQQAADRIQAAAQSLAVAGDAEGASTVAALGDVLTTHAADAPRYVREEIRAAAVAFERASRAPVAQRAASQARQHLQSATQTLMLGAMLASGGGEAAAAVALLNALALAVVAAHRWHQARGFRMQTEAAAAAGYQLRAATEITGGATTGGRTGRRRSSAHNTAFASLSSETAARFGDTVRRVLPAHADQITGDEAWTALAATLASAERAGYDPAAVLREVATQRELGSADSTAQVLVWRLQGRMRQDEAALAQPTTTGARKKPAPGPQSPGLGEQRAAQRAAQLAIQRTRENQQRGHGR